MKRQTSKDMRATTKPESPKLIEPESQFAKLRDLEEAIARRAFELFERRGCEHEQDLADWVRAESEMLQSLAIKVSEYRDRLAVKVELPGFSAEEIEVSAEPRRLIISGGTTPTDKEAGNTFLREIVANSTGILTKHIFRLLDLPVAIDVNKVGATLTGGILNVTLPRLVVDQSFHAQASGSYSSTQSLHWK
ncbi:MAG TPA: Hsp20 family protein [Blastocatellia bacterium]|nr:Hsp20 family protein [Blastocatellia bacterium]